MQNVFKQEGISQALPRDDAGVHWMIGQIY